MPTQSSSPKISPRMAKARRKSAHAEFLVRRELYRRDLRYRANSEVRKEPRCLADIAFPRCQIAVLSNGGFRHRGSKHATWPKPNAEFSRQKIEANRLRNAAEAIAHTIAKANARRCTSPASAQKKN